MKWTCARDGVWRSITHGPDGTDYPNKIVYSEIVSPERLVCAHGRDADAGDVQFQVKVSFAGQGGDRTLLRLAEHSAKMS